MENALWSLVAVGVIANAYRSEPRFIRSSQFWLRVRENLINLDSYTNRNSQIQKRGDLG
jgi:hypothetical protein